MVKFRHVNTLKIFDWFLIVGIFSTNIIYSILQQEVDFIGSIAGITGVICVVMVAKGNILNYFFGLVNVTLYGYISYKAELYGDAALNILYYLPMQFVGWFIWIRRRESAESVTVTSRVMNGRQRLILGILSFLLVVLVGYSLKYFKDPQPFKDSATTVLSIIAMFLMVRAYMEQWVLWVIVNIISVIMWVVAFMNGEMHSMLMVIMWIFYLTNSVSGWYTWLHLSCSEK
ncbi:MAG: nicotinamide riboside transporter PnuC [Rikenellaceae bacterium]|nr:nicotinamide riboside transporter PnuC [Rikenellaceae bacterium]